jgi:ADP-ribose pyrophosphatase
MSMHGDDDAHLVETKLASEVAFAGKLLEVRSDKVRLPNGGTGTREFVVHPGAALVVPVLANGSFILERQFRYPIGRVMLEFPAGKIDPGESPLATAQRELREEAGYTAATWAKLGTLHPEIGYSSEFIDVFEATGLTEVGQSLDDGEFLEIVTMTEDELLFTFDCGGFTDGKSIAALFAWRRQRRRKSNA